MIKFKQIKINFKKYFSLYRALYKDKRTPLIAKVFLWLAIGYFFLPFDVIPDFIPVLGQLDDAIIVPSLIFIALKCVPKLVYKENYEKIFKKPL